MKKIFTAMLVAIGLLTFTAATAQNRVYQYGNQGNYPVYQQNGQWNNHGGYQTNDGYNNRRWNNDYERQVEYDRMNQDCDRRIEGYRNDRRMSRYERNRRIQQVEYERQERARSFGKGMVVAGAAAILIGVLMSGGR